MIFLESWCSMTVQRAYTKRSPLKILSNILSIMLHQEPRSFSGLVKLDKAGRVLMMSTGVEHWWLRLGYKHCGSGNINQGQMVATLYSYHFLHSDCHGAQVMCFDFITLHRHCALLVKVLRVGATEIKMFLSLWFGLRKGFAFFIKNYFRSKCRKKTSK